MNKRIVYAVVVNCLILFMTIVAGGCIRRTPADETRPQNGSGKTDVFYIGAYDFDVLLPFETEEFEKTSIPLSVGEYRSIKLDGVPSMKTIDLESATRTAVYSTTKVWEGDPLAGDVLSRYGSSDLYEIDDGDFRASLEFLSDTDILLSYIRHDASDEDVSENEHVDKSSAAGICDSFLTNTMGIDNTAYELVAESEDPEPEGCFYFVYAKKAEGYFTNDRYSISVAKTGYVVAMFGYARGIAELSKMPSKEKITESIAAVKEIIAGNSEITDMNNTELYFGNDGTVYVAERIAVNMEDGTSSATMLLKAVS